MEEKIEEIEKELLYFCKKYNCAIEINTLTAGRDMKGNIKVLKICTKIQR